MKNLFLNKLNSQNIFFEQIKISDKNSLILKEEEEILNAFSSKKRQLEFRAGRIAAHNALKEFKLEHLPLLKNKKGDVAWPKNIIGSISHSNEYAVAAISNTQSYKGIGIDIEYLDRNRSIFERTLTDNEKKSCNTDDKIIFSSTKEAIYKAVFSENNLSLGWKDIELSRDSSNNIEVNISKYNQNIRIHENKKEDYICIIALILL